MRVPSNMHRTPPICAPALVLVPENYPQSARRWAIVVGRSVASVVRGLGGTIVANSLPGLHKRACKVRVSMWYSGDNLGQRQRKEVERKNGDLRRE